MAYTDSDLQALERAIATGERMVQFADRSVEYRSIDELIRARDEVRRSIAPQRAPLSGRTWAAVQGGKGL